MKLKAGTFTIHTYVGYKIRKEGSAVQAQALDLGGAGRKGREGGISQRLYPLVGSTSCNNRDAKAMERCGEDRVPSRGGEVVEECEIWEVYGQMTGRWGRTGEQEMIR